MAAEVKSGVELLSTCDNFGTNLRTLQEAAQAESSDVVKAVDIVQAADVTPDTQKSRSEPSPDDLLLKRKQQQAITVALLATLKKAQENLTQAVAQNRRASEEWEAKVNGLDARRAEQEIRMRALRSDLVEASQELKRLQAVERHCIADNDMAAALADRHGHSAQEDTALWDPSDSEGWVSDVRSSEQRLRALEDAVAEAETKRRDKARTLEETRKGNRELLHRSTSDNAELVSARKNLALIKKTLENLQERLRKGQEMRANLQGQFAGLDAQMQLLMQEEEWQRGRLASEQQLHQSADASLRESQQTSHAATRLEDAMMMLKAAATNLSDDLPFIAEVIASWSVPTSPDPISPRHFDVHPAVTGFTVAFSFIREWVVQEHHRQQEGERWLLRRGDSVSVTDDKVEDLLSAVKQMVVCFDALPYEAYPSLKVGKEVALNGNNLRDLALHLAGRLTVLQQTRREEAEAREKQYQERVRRSVLPPSLRKAARGGSAARALSPKSPNSG